MQGAPTGNFRVQTGHGESLELLLLNYPVHRMSFRTA